jgi:toluene monooxygenase electron transfer component
MHQVRIADGPEFACAEDDTLLRAGLRAGVGLPYECNAGSCGTCKVELLEGQIASLRPDAPGLGERDRAKNRILACQARPRSDCRIKVRVREENVPVHRPARFRATLAGTRDLTHDLREFTFKAAPGAPGFLPGQYALFYLPGLEAPRTYSMSNIDHGNGEWQFIVKRNPAGIGTNTLFDKVPVGAGVTLDGPYGLAYLRADSPRDIVLIGGGSGLAPVLSLARGAVAEPRLAGRRVHAYYGGRGERDLCGAQELECLPGFGDRLTYTQVVSETDGFVHERVKRDLGDRFKDFEFYFAGPPPMAEAVQRMLMDARVPYPQVHFDSFY